MKSSQTSLNRIGTMGAARYLLSTKSPEQFQIELCDDDHIQNYLMHLTNEKSWLVFKKYIQAEIKKIKKELSDVPGDTQLQKTLAQLELQEKNTQKIDALIQDGKLQEWFTLKDETALHMEHAETVTDVATTLDEMVNQSIDYSEQLSTMEHAEKIVELTPAIELMRSIPLINDYVRGLNYLREAYEAYRDPHIPQRKTKIAASLFGGLVSLGMGIVGSLLLAGAGLMATTAAVVITPIVISALTVGIYSVALYRDGYILHQAKKQYAKMANEMYLLDSDMASEKEVIISRYLNQLPEENSMSAELAETHNAINDKRNELIEFLRKYPAWHSRAIALRYQLTDLCHERNEQLLLQHELHEKIIEKFYLNPRIARLSIQKVNLAYSLNQLNQARIKARRKVMMSVLSCVGVGFALLAVCMTGGLALGFAALGAGILVSSTVVKLYISHREKNNAKENMTQSPQNQIQFHAGELQIEKRLLHGKQQDIAYSLARRVASVETAQKKMQKNAVKVVRDDKKVGEDIIKESDEDNESPHQSL